MTIQFACSKCATPFRLDNDKAGKRSRCPRCRTFLTVPCRPTISQPALLNSAFASDRRAEPEVPSEEEIFRILEELKPETQPVESNKSGASDETVLENAVLSPLTPTPAMPMPPVPTRSIKSDQSMSAAEAAESALRKVREARKRG